jgi:K+-transporting ATPase ATPase C chain
MKIISALKLFSVLSVITGVIYPLSVTVLANVIFPFQAGGSLIKNDKVIIGSELIAQNFTKGKYFHPRPSAAGTSYDASNSGASNLSYSNESLRKSLIAQYEHVKSENINKIPITTDMLTASGSGLDPHISVESANLQAARVARSRNISHEHLDEIILQYTESKLLGIFGRPRINVLKINLALDKYK